MAMSASSGTWAPGLSMRWPATTTSPAMMARCAFSRLGNEPRATRRVSRRCLGAFNLQNNGLRRRAFQLINHLPAMASPELKESIKEMMVENLMLRTPKEEIGDDLPLFGPEGLGLDSIDALELVVSLEKHFGVTVPNSDVARNALATVDTIADYVESHRAKL